MNPIIIVCGTPHSYTSVVSKFLQLNGGFCEDNYSPPEYDLDYDRFEAKEIVKYIAHRKKLQNYDLKPYFDSLPEDKVVTIKAPLAITFIHEFKQFTSRPIKVVFCIRNPQDVILSSMDKDDDNFIKYSFRS